MCLYIIKCAFTFLDRDLQCDFNNMYWEESECSWSFRPTLTKGLSFSQTPYRMTRRLVDPLTDTTLNYWQQKDTSFGRCLECYEI